MRTTTNLFIPDKIKVGFQERKDTYTKKLAYVIYYDKKGVLRKEKSWEGWRDKKIDAVEADNEPTEGFVLNKGVGGVRQSYGWNTRNEYVRVYDPRNFEFEISIPNLLFILRECDCSRGKGLEGKFVYAWDKNNLVLLPAISTDYQQSKKFTDLQGTVVKAKELIDGATYYNKNAELLTYVGRFDYHFPVSKNDDKAVCKKYVFHGESGFEFMDTPKCIARLDSDTVSPDYAALVDQYNKSPHGSRIVRLFVEERAPKKRDKDRYYYGYDYSDPWCYPLANPEHFAQCITHHHYYSKPPIIDEATYQKKFADINYVSVMKGYHVHDGKLVRGASSANAYPPGTKSAYDHYGRYTPLEKWVDPTNMRLFAELESGSKYRVVNNDLTEDTELTTENEEN